MGIARDDSLRARVLRSASALLATSVLLAGPGSVASIAASAPSRAPVLEAQRLFHELGYPLGHEAPGHLGVRTRGALSYFQRKYGLPVTGRPEAGTLAAMRRVAASLRGTPGRAQPQPHDLVERVLGNGLPLLAIAAALAALLGLLALSARGKPAAQESASAEDMIVLASGES